MDLYVQTAGARKCRKSMIARNADSTNCAPPSQKHLPNQRYTTQPPSLFLSCHQFQVTIFYAIHRYNAISKVEIVSTRQTAYFGNVVLAMWSSRPDLHDASYPQIRLDIAAGMSQ
jgi:hypothetical protein